MLIRRRQRAGGLPVVRQPHPASLIAACLLTVAAVVLIAPGTGLVAPAAEVSAAPALDSVDLMPGQPLAVTVDNGTIVAMTVTDQTGAAVPGTLQPDGSSWSYDGNLGYGNTYTATGAAIGADGQVTRISGTYRTVKPVEQVTPTIYPETGDVVGVAAPVIVSLSREPADRQAVEDRLQITTNPPVEGSWAWIQHDGRDGPSLDWRPKESGRRTLSVSLHFGLTFTNNSRNTFRFDKFFYNALCVSLNPGVLSSFHLPLK